MASSTETRVVYAAGVVQGIALVTFPAASTILTDPAEYDLSSTQYGALFLPQVRIAAFGVGPLLAGGIGLPTIYASAAVIAVILGGWSFLVARRRPSPASLHPHLGH
jgi:hypothetical protein